LELSELGAGAEVVGVGAWSYRSLELGAVGAWSLELLEQGSYGWSRNGTQVSIFTFFLVCLFCLFCLFFFAMFLWSCAAAQRSEEGDALPAVAFFFLF